MSEQDIINGQLVSHLEMDKSFNFSELAGKWEETRTTDEIINDINGH